ncbi:MULTISPECIES: LysR substrate-binding domain-containing protein [unclassified Sphingobium]|uniref:LysR substrate-binding domain-containing protein n=1 Tax=unclassified Sphingobium TaxID=2611147 RepID=UPI0035A5DEF6
MPRHINLRQIEAFKAVIENGTVSRASEILNVSQPALSKLIAHLEFDTALRLFDRVKGRLAPTEHGMRLYDEVGRIFSGVRQVENAVEAIRREEQGRLAIGVLPALANTFIQKVTTGFLQARGNVFCSVQAVGSQWIVEWLVSRKLDVGLVSARVDNPYLTMEPVLEQPLVCIMPPDHALAAKTHIEPQDLIGTPFIAFDSDIYVAHLVATTLERYKVEPQIVLVTNAAPTVCEFVAAGLGVSLIHPLMVSGLEHRVAVRRFQPEIPYNFQLCRSADSRNAHIVEAFVEELRERANEAAHSLLVEHEAAPDVSALPKLLPTKRGTRKRKS